MAQIVIKSIPPLRNLKGRFETAHKQLLEDHRDMMRVQGRRMKELAQDEAPVGKTGKFKAGIRFRTFAKGAQVGFTVSTPSPLGDYISEGTRPHIIRAKEKKALYFFWPKFGGYVVVPRRPSGPTRVVSSYSAYGGGRKDTLWIGKGYVNHPGTKPNPYLSRAFRRWLPGARADLSKASTRYVRTITGAKKGEATLKA